MTLALIFFLGSFLTLPVPQSAQAAPQTPAASPSSSTPPATQQNPPTAKPASDTTATPSAKKPATKKARRHKKTKTANCAPAPSTPSSSETASGSDPAGGASGAAAQAATNCPPSKIIVRQGGTKEPSIQLAGDQTSEQRNAINQMLGSTDVNLKKLSGQQLSANQQDMVKQVRQFMEQSKSAMQGGDMERARTLAWKAQLLAEELANPGK